MAARRHTSEDIEQRGGDALCLLIEGELQLLSPVGAEHAIIWLVIQGELGSFVRRRRLGYLFPPDAGFIFGRSPDTVLSPDAAFVRRNRLPRPVPEGFLDLIPDMAIEINSPSDRRVHIERKLDIYMRAGVPLVWEIQPSHRSVVVHRPGQESVEVPETGVLDGDDIVPGFRLAVAGLFADLDADGES